MHHFNILPVDLSLTTETIFQLVNLDALGRDEDDSRQQHDQLHLLLRLWPQLDAGKG